MISPSDIHTYSIKENIYEYTYTILLTLIDGTHHEIKIPRRTIDAFRLERQLGSLSYQERIIELFEHAGYNIELAQDYSI